MDLSISLGVTTVNSKVLSATTFRVAQTAHKTVHFFSEPLRDFNSRGDI
jgi:hypothetical protein